MTADVEALRALAADYARGVDRREEATFLGVFAPDAVMEIPRGEIRGREALAGILDRIARYERTFHLIGNATYDVDGDGATGEVYCVAHHWTAEGSLFVMYIRYRDVYRRGADGWRIAERRLLLDATETREGNGDTAAN